MKLSFKALTFTALLFTLAACSTLQPQQLSLHPQVVTRYQLPSDIAVNIETYDARKNEVVGLRKTGKTPAPEITLNNAASLLHHAAEHALKDMGVNNFSSGDFKLHLGLLKLDYQADKKGLNQEINLAMQLKLNISKFDESYSAQYTTDKHHHFVVMPSPGENEQIINQLFNETLTRAFNDHALIDFLRNNR